MISKFKIHIMTIVLVLLSELESTAKMKQRYNVKVLADFGLKKKEKECTEYFHF
jgi:hypothetical protein